MKKTIAYLRRKLLDQYKYPNRYPELNPEDVLRDSVERILKPMETTLNSTQYLLGDSVSWVDIAIFPFIRQFAMVDSQRFAELALPATQKWLAQLIESPLFESVMEKHPVWIDSSAN
ncbi:glutathione binding-like protein [Polynucleobacter necessarius]|uniref:glutathione binding-like protein n=1 Tax=Polynucleobacter necessarius TaxID=576610 RepID=UPI001E5B311F|nr:glutathione binding-like protein [Polynucleobacter necessarius]